jgi:hypothetical protein
MLPPLSGLRTKTAVKEARAMRSRFQTSAEWSLLLMWRLDGVADLNGAAGAKAMQR